MNLSFQIKMARPILVTLDVLEQIQATNGQEPALEEVQTHLKRSLGTFDAHGAEGELQQLARRAIIYWMDERLVNAEWQHARRWNDQTLELQLLGTRNRARAFYDDAMLAEGMERLDAFEIYAVCAALGFQGLYRQQLSESDPLRDAIPEDKPEEKNDDAGSRGSEDSPDVDDKKATPELAKGKSVGSQPSGTKSEKEDPETAEVGTEHGHDQAVAMPEAADEAQDTSPSFSEREELDPIPATNQLPETYSEWVSSAFDQLSIRRLTGFLPHDPLESVRSAKPLTAGNGLTWWLITFAIFLLITILLLDFGVLS